MPSSAWFIPARHCTSSTRRPRACRNNASSLWSDAAAALSGAGSYDGSEFPGSAYPAYGYSPGHLGPDYYGSDVVIGGGSYWAHGNDRDPYSYRHRGQAWQRHDEAQA